MDDALEESISSYGKHRVGFLLAWIILVLLTILLLDSFVLRPVVVAEIFKTEDTAAAKNYETGADFSHVIIAESGRHFQVPRRPFNTIYSGQPFLIGHSRIFRRPLFIVWREDDGFTYKSNIGLLKYFPGLACLYYSFLSCFGNSSAVAEACRKTLDHCEVVCRIRSHANDVCVVFDSTIRLKITNKMYPITAPVVFNITSSTSALLNLVAN